jgi:hypothetical protein
MPVPPEAKLEVFQTPEAQAMFDAGEGGPLATTPAMANGVWGPPIGMWRAGNMMPYFNIVRIHFLPSSSLVMLCECLDYEGCGHLVPFTMHTFEVFTEFRANSISSSCSTLHHGTFRACSSCF